MKPILIGYAASTFFVATALLIAQTFGACLGCAPMGMMYLLLWVYFYIGIVLLSFLPFMLLRYTCIARGWRTFRAAMIAGAALGLSLGAVLYFGVIMVEVADAAKPLSFMALTGAIGGAIQLYVENLVGAGLKEPSVKAGASQ